MSDEAAERLAERLTLLAERVESVTGALLELADNIREDGAPAFEIPNEDDNTGEE